MESYSQASQDIFVLYFNEYKQNGSFLEIGSNHPINGNNSYVLEYLYNWKGIMIEYEREFENLYKQYRKSKYIIDDATKLDYNKILTEFCKYNNLNNELDYLQIDLEVENNSTLECLYNFKDNVFNKFKFKVITFEHDFYRDINKNTREISRNIFNNFGYILLFPDITVWNDNKYCNFEDWYVHPSLINKKLIDKYTNIKLNYHKDIENIFINDNNTFLTTFNNNNILLRNFIKTNEFTKNLLFAYDLLLDINIKKQLIQYIYDYISFNKNLLELQNLISNIINNKFNCFKYIVYKNNYTVCVYNYEFNDTFDFEISDNTLKIFRTDLNEGWGLNLNLMILKNNEYKFINVGNNNNNTKYINI